MIVFVRNLVVNDFWLKLFSLALAILIWFTIQFSMNKEVSPWAAIIGRTSDETVLTVPVHVPLADASAVSVDPPQVQVTVHADPKVLQDLKSDDVRAQVNLAGIESANGLRRRIDVILPPGVSYTHIAPDEVEVRVSPKN